jgi:hypothetical protein
MRCKSSKFGHPTRLNLMREHLTIQKMYKKYSAKRTNRRVNFCITPKAGTVLPRTQIVARKNKRNKRSFLKFSRFFCCLTFACCVFSNWLILFLLGIGDSATYARSEQGVCLHHRLGRVSLIICMKSSSR